MAAETIVPEHETRESPFESAEWQPGIPVDQPPAGWDPRTTVYGCRNSRIRVNSPTMPSSSC